MTSSNNAKDWDKNLPTVQCGYNQTVHKAHQFAPHTLLYGYRYPIPSDVIRRRIPDAPLDPEENIALERIVEHTRRLRETAKENEARYMIQKEREANKKAKPHTFESGDLVYRKVPKVLKHGKLKARYEGPFELTENHGTHFGIKEPDAEEDEGKVHARRIKPAKTQSKLYP